MIDKFGQNDEQKGLIDRKPKINFDLNWIKIKKFRNGLNGINLKSVNYGSNSPNPLEPVLQ